MEVEGVRVVQVGVVEEEVVEEEEVMEVLLVVEMSLLIEVLVEGMDVVDEDDEIVVEVVTVLSGVVALEEMEPDDAETPLADGEAIVALEISDNAPDDSALDWEEAPLEDVKRLKILEPVLAIVDILSVLVCIAEVEEAMLDSVWVLRMTDMVFELERVSDALSCAFVPISTELLGVAPAVTSLKVPLVCVSVVSCIRVDGLTSVDWSCVDEGDAGIVIIVVVFGSRQIPIQQLGNS